MNFFKIVRFDFTNILRNPMLVIFNTVFPLLLITIMGFVMQDGFGAGPISSYDYYGVTLMIFTALMIAMTVSNTFMEEKVKSGNTRIICAPVAKAEIYLSKLVATYILGTVCYTAILLGGQYLFHINFGGRNILPIILLINIFTLFGCCLGTMFCCIFKSEEGANTITPLLIAVLVFFGGVFFPVDSLGKVVAGVSLLSPVRWVTQCAFEIIYDHNFSIFLPVVLLTLLASAVCIAVCQINFKPEEYV